jgi:hypothetical protein
MLAHLVDVGQCVLGRPIAARILKPAGPVCHPRRHQQCVLVGQHCKVLTQTVDEKAGRAEVAQRGANINIRVWAPSPNPLVRGSMARIVAYEEKTARYRIEADG